MTLLAAFILIPVCLVCVLLTLIGLPGTWLMLLSALGVQWMLPGTYDWWTLGIAGVVCILAEVAELASGAVGASSAGASKRASAGAIVGGLAGAIIGTFAIPIPIVGTIIGGGIGAGAGAMLLEVTKDQEIRKSSSVLAVGKGAAVGRLLATVIKTIFALAVAGIVLGGAFVG